MLPGPGPLAGDGFARLGGPRVGGVLVLPILGGSLIGSVLLPLFTIAVGAIVAWSNLDEAQRSRWLESGTGPNRFGWMRVALGVGLTVTGILVLGFSADPHTFDIRELSQTEISDVLLPLPAIFFLIFAGFAVKRLKQNSRLQRRKRIRVSHSNFAHFFLRIF